MRLDLLSFGEPKEITDGFYLVDEAENRQPGFHAAFMPALPDNPNRHLDNEIVRKA